MLTKQFYRDEKIPIFSSTVVCLSFTTLNVSENKKVIIKIPVYSSVINKLDKCASSGAICVGRFTRFDQIITDFP